MAHYRQRSETLRLAGLADVAVSRGYRSRLDNAHTPARVCALAR